MYLKKKTINKGFQDCFFTLCESLWSAGKLYQSRQWVCALCGLAASHSYAFSEFSSLTPSLLKCQQLSIWLLSWPCQNLDIEREGLQSLIYNILPVYCRVCSYTSQNNSPLNRRHATHHVHLFEGRFIKQVKQSIGQRVKCG